MAGPVWNINIMPAFDKITRPSRPAIRCGQVSCAGMEASVQKNDGQASINRHGGRQLLYITPAGRRQHDMFMPGLELRERNMMACLSEREYEQLERLLRKMCAHAPEWNTLPLNMGDPGSKEA